MRQQHFEGLRRLDSLGLVEDDAETRDNFGGVENDLSHLLETIHIGGPELVDCHMHMRRLRIGVFGGAARDRNSHLVPKVEGALGPKKADGERYSRDLLCWKSASPSS